jgi:calcineurin-like phosphoesterase family protein
MIYFTSDLHLGHTGIITMQNRPFKDVDEMNRVLIRNYNSLINRNDTVYLLGDICHHMTVEQANEIISKFNGKKILLTGNHDKKYDPSLFEEICDFKTISIDNTYFVLMHYPIMSWSKMHSGSVHVHGHIHSDELYNLQNQENGIKRYDVGVDANNFYPVSAKQIIEFFQ